MGKQTMDQASIIEAWERTHRPKRSRSRLSDHDVLIRQKIDEGYTQQAVTELLLELGCPTTHQNLSRYLKSKQKKPISNAKNTVNSPNRADMAKPTSDFSQFKEKMQGV